jgi:hypothetical protein
MKREVTFSAFWPRTTAGVDPRLRRRQVEREKDRAGSLPEHPPVPPPPNNLISAPGQAGQTQGRDQPDDYPFQFHSPSRGLVRAKWPVTWER